MCDQSSRLNNDATYGMSCEYMTFSNLCIVCRVNIYFLICDTAPTRGMIFDKHDKSRRYLTLMTGDLGDIVYLPKSYKDWNSPRS